MQGLLDGPRSGLTEAAVRGLLQSHSAVQFKFGADALDSDFSEVGDISDYVGKGSTISSDITQTVHRTCNLNIDADVTDTGWSYLSGFVRPYVTMVDVATGIEATFHLGVYTLTTPTRALQLTPATLQFQGYDLVYLLRQDMGDSYEVPAGSDPAQAAADVIGLAIPGVESLVTPSGSTLDRQMTWPFNPTQPVTYLHVVQELLKACGYREVWVDWEGRFVIEPFIDLQEATPEWVFNTNDDDNIVADNTTQDVDIYSVPNWWRFVMSDQADTPQEGVSQFTWEDASPMNPGSTYNRGITVRYTESVKVTSYDDLVQYAQRKIVATLTPGETFTVQTFPFPLAWHMDVIHFVSDALIDTLPASPTGERRVVSATWTLPMDGESDMEWTWQTVTDQTAGLGMTTLTE